MPTPVFQDYTPDGDCACAGCAEQRAALRRGGHPAAHGPRRALVLVTAAGVVLGGGGGTAAAVDGPAAGPSPGPGAAAGAPEPETPQGRPGVLHGPGAPLPGPGPTEPAPVRRIDRATIIKRAQLWLDAKVPYSMAKYWTDGYRQDCSGYVSMAWDLGSNEWTGSLDTFATPITKDELLPGDMLLFHNPDNPSKGSHVTLFGGWTDHTRTQYLAYEQTPPETRRLATPYGYWKNADKYLPYRYNGVTGGITDEPPAAEPMPGPGASAAYPGRYAFGPGADNAQVARLGRLLIGRGGARFYPSGPSSRWKDADRLATQAFQRAQGWRGTAADGLPGPATWRLLVRNQGRNIPPAAGTPVTPVTVPGRPLPAPGSAPARPGPAGLPGRLPGAGPAYPGAAVFRPGQSHAAITALGRRLQAKGFGKHYTTGPGPAWTEADRRNVEAFQRAQGWRGSAADGHPGPETWRRLFA
ncbi:peptidoglycan-binding protein [Streptomyces bambusae]|uniref:peptidoglycan-binding protein n=1 Tax=Streptomyces bambusae TaxID=1550616 RepID=UPI001CFD74E1|nr:peptidoglycan-binding protein [Streptomyces bambusae]MCB5167898.1 peptidoglycan-binding protein [Streptomyces bambusae]